LARELKGLIFPIVTPFTPSFELDEEKLREEIGYLLDKSIHGFLVNGSTGECLSLSSQERQRIIEIVAQMCKGKVPIIAGVEDSATSKAVVEAKLARNAGADAALVVTPPYLKPTFEGIFRHYEQVNQAGVPFLLYNNPFRTGFTLSPQMIDKLTTLNNAIGLKQSEENLSNTAEIIRLVDNKISVIHSYGRLSMFPGLLFGGKGAMPQIFFFAPEKVHELYEAVKSGNAERARKIWFELLPLEEAIGGVHGEPNPVPFKEAMRIAGYPMGPCRLPLTPATEDTSKRIEKIFRDYKLIK